MFDNTTIIAMAAFAALAAGVTALRYPRLCFGILFLVASFSKDTLSTPLGTLRPEMPAIVVVAAVLLAGRRFESLRRLPRPTLAMCLAFAAYLAVLAISSAFVAPDRSQSLHMVAWFAISMLGGVVAFVLVQPRPEDAIEPLALVGATMGVIGILVAAAFLVAGPAFSFGIQDGYAALPRVYGLAWEANLYASFLAFCAFFALEAARGRRAAAGLVMFAAILVGFPLGVTRGAYLGLVAGAVTYAVVRLVLERRPRDLLRPGAISAALLAVGIGASLVMLPNVLQRQASGPPVAVATATATATTTATELPASEAARTGGARGARVCAPGRRRTRCVARAHRPTRRGRGRRP